MRQNVLIVLLSVIATLLAVDVFRPTPSAQGQLGGGGTAMVGGEIVGATGATMGGGGAAFWLYENSKKRIAVYTLGNQGLELRAVRDVQFDLQATYLNQPQGKMTKLSEVRQAVAKMKKGEDKEEEEAPKNTKKGKKEEE